MAEAYSAEKRGGNMAEMTCTDKHSGDQRIDGRGSEPADEELYIHHYTNRDDDS